MPEQVHQCLPLLLVVEAFFAIRFLFAVNNDFMPASPDSPTSPVHATGLLLTGGGARAAYQVGVLEAIADMRKAAGASLQANPFPIIIPCHRVLASNGIGGFGGGAGSSWRPGATDPIAFKRALLRGEGVDA